MAEEMRIDPQRAKQLADNLSNVVHHIQTSSKSNRPVRLSSVHQRFHSHPVLTTTWSDQVRLILVSKLKPVSDIYTLHKFLPSSPGENWTSHFGENYYQELLEKASLLPRSIKWHFIGGLQSNKCKPLAEQVPNLWCVSSVDAAKKADQLEKGRAALVKKVEEKGLGEQQYGEGAGFEKRLRVMVQVNTSGEESKSGVEPADTLELCRHIIHNCPHLRLSGLMTIGAIARSQVTTAENENEDFECLKDTRDKVAKSLGIAAEELELSMGMSSDYEGAIAQGSDEVRIGTTIFGTRPPKKDAKIIDEMESVKA